MPGWFDIIKVECLQAIALRGNLKAKGGRFLSFSLWLHITTARKAPGDALQVLYHRRRVKQAPRLVRRLAFPNLYYNPKILCFLSKELAAREHKEHKEKEARLCVLCVLLRLSFVVAASAALDPSTFIRGLTGYGSASRDLSLHTS
jgi:hypothetical protein